MFDRDLIHSFFEPFNWDKSLYKFTREEKDMNPYSITTNENTTIIVHNVVGLNKEDLTLTRKSEDGIVYLVIEGETKDAITGKKYSVYSRFALDENQLDTGKISSTMQNGLLYISIPLREQTQDLDNIVIEIK